MELAGKVVFGLFTLIVLCLIAGVVDTWWEQRKRDKNKRG